MWVSNSTRTEGDEPFCPHFIIMESQITKNAITKVMLTLNDKVNYSGEISRKLGITFSTVVKIIKEMNNNNLVEFNKKGRIKYLTLTSKGIKLKNLLTEIKQL